MRRFLYGFIVANLLFLVFTNRTFKDHSIAYLVASGYQAGCVSSEVSHRGSSNGLIYLECSLKAIDVYRTILLMNLKPTLAPFNT